jgi:hypothetical protein
MNATASVGPDVVVQRASVDVVRRGGWSWGSDPDALVRRVLDALSALLARELAGLPDDTHVEITEPVVLDVRVRLSELLAGGVGRVSLRSPAGPGRVQAAVRMGDLVLSPASAGSEEPGPVDMAAVPAPPPDSTPPDSAPPRQAPADPAWTARPAAAFVAELAVRHEFAALIELLPEQSRRGLADAVAAAVGPDDSDAVLVTLLPTLASHVELAALLELLPISALRTWREIWATRPRSGSRPGTALETADAVSGELDAAIARLSTGSPATEAAPPGGAAGILADLPRSAPTPPARVASPAGSAPSAIPEASPPPALPVPDVLSAVRPSRDRGPVEVESALPFLVTGPLARLGVLDALLPAMAAAGVRGGTDLVTRSQLFAAALGCTVLGPLRRGWLRNPADRTAAAAFAGLDDLPDEAVSDLVRTDTAAAPVLDAVVALALCRGHSPDRPLLLAEVRGEAGEGLLLADPEGLFPISWTGDTDLVLRHWTACGRPLMLLGEPTGREPVLGPVGQEYLRPLAAAGVRFATGLPPIRGERWHRLPGRRCWISPGADPAPGVVTSLARLPGELSRLDGLVRALAVERRAAPLAPPTGLARTLPLVAALGLGTISWLLWKDREPTDPLLTLERFADLSGVVRFGPDEVAVRVPLGRRHSDLLRNGLLADVRDVPWLHGRTLTFTGG